MSNIRDLGRKITSLKNMQKVTRAMNMISSIKLRKLYVLQPYLNLFNRKTDELRLDFLGGTAGIIHPVLTGYSNISKVHLIIFTADKGLCGTHNSNVLKAAEKFISEQTSDGIDIEITSIGNKGTNFCRRKKLELYTASEIAERTFDKKKLHSISDKIFNRFIEGNVQKVYILGNIFYSALQQETELKQVLPVIRDDSEEKEESIEMQFEPSAEELASAGAFLIMKYKLNAYFLNSLLSEHSSRMTAMENATNNSEDLINKYIIMQNHARQAAITSELIEIVSGKEALKG